MKPSKLPLAAGGRMAATGRFEVFIRRKTFAGGIRGR